MSIRMRHTKGHSGNRRSHHALKGQALSACDNCGVPRQNHRLCKQCGFYGKKKVTDVVKEVEKKGKKQKQAENK